MRRFEVPRNLFVRLLFGMVDIYKLQNLIKSKKIKQFFYDIHFKIIYKFNIYTVKIKNCEKVNNFFLISVYRLQIFSDFIFSALAKNYIRAPPIRVLFCPVLHCDSQERLMSGTVEETLAKSSSIQVQSRWEQPSKLFWNNLKR